MNDSTLFKPEVYAALIEKDPSLPTERQLDDINTSLMNIYTDSKLMEAVRRYGKLITFASYAPFPADYDGFGYLSLDPERGLLATRITTDKSGDIVNQVQYLTRPNGRFLQLFFPDLFEVNRYMIGDPAYMCEEVSGKPGNIPRNFDKSKIPTGREILLSLEEAIRKSINVSKHSQ